jgi:DNA-binding CsgD family transcriptional regulator
MTGAKPPSLSIRQARALALVAQGWAHPEIGSRLKIAPRVVLLYLIHLQRYLETRTPGELIQVLLQARLLPMEWARAQAHRQGGRKPEPAKPPAAQADDPRAGGVATASHQPVRPPGRK